MPTEIIIILSICAILIAFLYYQINILIKENYILKTSIKIYFMKELNLNTKFNVLQQRLKINKHYDNKGYYQKIEPAFLMSAEIRNQLELFREYINKIRENRELKINYELKVETILKEEHQYNKENEKMLNNSYKKREIKLLNQMIQNPVVDSSLCVFMSYSSPKGQVNLNKSKCFNFDDIFTAFESVSRTYLSRDDYNHLSLVERGDVSDSLRYDILKRDGFRCVICGASANEGVRLHVDHIIPIAKGGKSNPENLRTLCERCNVGKSDKLEEFESEDVETKCPHCGGGLVLRHGKNGDFYGCSNYPTCRYTKTLKTEEKDE